MLTTTVVFLSVVYISNYVINTNSFALHYSNFILFCTPEFSQYKSTMKHIATNIVHVYDMYCEVVKSYSSCKFHVL